MTLNEASRRFHINIEKLMICEENGLLECKKVIDGVPDYTENELHKVGLIQSLLKAGFDIDSLKSFFRFDGKKEDKQERIQLLRKQRLQLLDEIHEKQQSLDEIDYLIDKIRKE